MHPSRNISTGDVVILTEDGMLPTQWPLAMEWLKLIQDGMELYVLLT